MSYQRDPRTWIQTETYGGNSITFCSCILCGTQVEQTPSKREMAVMWIKEAASGAGLVIFMVSAFVLAGGASVISL